MIPRRLLDAFSGSDSFTALEKLVEGEWDLTITVEARRRSGDERAATLINRLIHKLHDTITVIAGQTAEMARIAPRQADLSRALEARAREQAQSAGEIAAASAELATSIHNVSDVARKAAEASNHVAGLMQQLNAKSQNLEEIIDLMGVIAQQTKLVALNASVEAARAGDEGVAFAAVAAEMRQLATQAAETTAKTSTILFQIRDEIRQAVGAIGSTNASATSGAAPLLDQVRQIAAAGAIQDAKVQGVSQSIRDVAEIARQQSEAAGEFSALGGKIRDCCDALVTSVGVFRLAAHQRALTIVLELAAEPEIVSMSRERQEARLTRAVREHPFFELFYVTDAWGRQTIRNISDGTFTAAYASDGYNENWSDRPWFAGVLRQMEGHVSHVYRSVASGEFCFTIALPLRNEDGDFLGVLGADVNVADLMAIR